MNKAKKFLIFTNLVYLNITSKIITSDPLLSLVKVLGIFFQLANKRWSYMTYGRTFNKIAHMR